MWSKMGCGVRSTDSPGLICVEESMEYLDKLVLFSPDGVPCSQITGSSMQKGDGCARHATKQLCTSSSVRQPSHSSHMHV